MEGGIGIGGGGGFEELKLGRRCVNSCGG